jgi:hypothetical protein
MDARAGSDISACGAEMVVNTERELLNGAIGVGDGVWKKADGQFSLFVYVLFAFERYPWTHATRRCP